MRGRPGMGRPHATRRDHGHYGENSKIAADRHGGSVVLPRHASPSCRAMSDPLARLAQASAVGWILMLLSGCAYRGLSIEQHYSTYAAQLPDNNKIFVCSAYGCRTRSEFKFTPGDIAKLRSLMAEPKRGADPRKERVRLG